MLRGTFPRLQLSRRSESRRSQKYKAAVKERIVEMSAEDFLLTLAEVSITFAGFSGLLAVVRRLGSPWTPAEVVGLWYMVATTVGALFFSLLPFLLFFFGLGEPLSGPSAVHC